MADQRHRDDLLANLLGLPGEQAELYRTITRRGPITASEAAKALGRNRARAYEILRELVQQGVLSELPGRPLRFEVVSVHRLLADKQEELAQMSSRLTAARATLPREDEVDKPPNRVAILGAEDLRRETVRMCRRAQTELIVVGARTFQEPNHLGEVLEALRGPIGTRSVKVYLEDDTDNHLRNAVHAALGAPPIEYSPMSFPDVSAVASEHGVLFIVPESTHDASGRVGVYVESSVIGEFGCLAVKHLLQPAKSIPLTDGGGNTLLLNYKQLLGEAHRSVDLILGAGWATQWPRAEVSEIAQLYLNALERGVHVRILMQHSLPELMLGLETGVLQKTQTRTLHTVPLFMCIIDQEVVLKSVGSREGVISVTHRSSDEVRFSHEVFARLWGMATPLEPI